MQSSGGHWVRRGFVKKESSTERERCVTPVSRRQCFSIRRYAILRTMSKRVDEAVEVLRELPKHEAEELAEAIIAYAETNADVQLSDVQVREIERRLAHPSPQYLTLEHVRKGLRRLGV